LMTGRISRRVWVVVSADMAREPITLAGVGRLLT
jgi:hypothetical protein